METFVKIRIYGKADQFFFVDYQISVVDHQTPNSAHRVVECGEGSLPPCSELIANIKDWRAAYHATVRTPRIEKDPSLVRNSSDIDRNKLTRNLTINLNKWLSSPEFLPMRDKLMAGLNRNQVILVGIDINDSELKYAPWQLWDFFEHFPKADYALLRPSASRVGENLGKKKKEKLNIMAIIGDSTDINTEEDQTIIRSLPGVHNPKILSQTSKAKVTEALWGSESVDILFFAGHGKKNQGKGEICINDKETLGVEEIRSALRKRIEQGLQLAIFNSCDGLELGEELADLHIPQAIVMKEAVPDDIAQRFLKDFLTEFSQGVPLVQALRQTRNKLKDQERDYPYASWLPVLYCNPTEPLMQWSRPQPSFLQRYPWQTKLAASCLIGLVGIASWTAYVFKSNQLPVGANQTGTSQIANKPYEEKSYGIKLTYPENWVLQERFDGITGNVVQLFPADNPEFTLTLNIQNLSKRSLTLENFKEKIIEDLQKYSKDFKLIQTEVTTLAYKQGYKLSYTNSRQGIRYQVVDIFAMEGNNGYIITYLTPESSKSLFAKYEPQAKQIIDSLTTLD